MARFYLSVWIWDGYPESGRAIDRAEDLVGDSCAKFVVKANCFQFPVDWKVDRKLVKDLVRARLAALG